MKQLILDPNNLNRNHTLTVFEKMNKDLVREIRADRTYKMPKNYINWQQLTRIIALALSTCDLDYVKTDISAFLHSYRTALWFVQDAPLYCLTREIIEAFDRTDALHKPNILLGWQPSLPTFLLTLPKKLIYTPDGAEIDYLIISCSDSKHPEWNTGKWKNIQIEPFNLKYHLYFHICTVDTHETVWTSGTAIAPDGTLIYDESSSIGKHRLTTDDKEFIQRLRNLIINVLLALEFSPQLLTTVSDSDTSSPNKGFIKQNSSSTLTRYPRWLGNNYQISAKTTSSIASKTTHLSPCTHWRRGHWRVLESNEGKRWKQSKRLWIEPVLVNS